MKLIQLIIATLLFALAAFGVIVHGFITDSIHGSGWLFAAIILILVGNMVGITYKEYKDEWHYE